MKKLLIISALLLFAGIAFGQTLKKGSLAAISVYTVTLNPGVTMDQYVDYALKNYDPAIEKSFPGTKAYSMKGDRGKDANKLGAIWIFESVEIRDKYFDTEGNMTELGSSSMQKLTPVLEELNNLGGNEREYTDWVIL